MSEIPARVWYDANQGRMQVNCAITDSRLHNAIRLAGLPLRYVALRVEDGSGGWFEASVSVPQRASKGIRFRHTSSDDTPGARRTADHELEAVRRRAELRDPAAGWGHATVLQLFDEIDRLTEQVQLAAAAELTRLDEQLDAEAAPSDTGARALALLEALVDDSPCQLDHHGACQMHGAFALDAERLGGCPNALARDLLEHATTKETA